MFRACLCACVCVSVGDFVFASGVSMALRKWDDEGRHVGVEQDVVGGAESYLATAMGPLQIF